MPLGQTWNLRETFEKFVGVGIMIEENTSTCTKIYDAFYPQMSTCSPSFRNPGYADVYHSISCCCLPDIFLMTSDLELISTRRTWRYINSVADSRWSRLPDRYCCVRGCPASLCFGIRASVPLNCQLHAGSLIIVSSQIFQISVWLRDVVGAEKTFNFCRNRLRPAECLYNTR